MMSSQVAHKKAFAFAITMWIIASLLFATVVLSRFAKEELGLSKGLNNKLQTQLIASSVLESLKFYIPTADYSSTTLSNELLTHTAYPLPTEIVVDGREYNLTNGVTISLQDTSALLNVAYSSSSMIAKALTGKRNEELEHILKNSLDDWRDEDNVPKINGAEQSSYRSVGKKAIVRNTKALQDIHELTLINGFDKVDFNLIKANLYYGRGSSINLLLIKNRAYLAALLGTTDSFMQDMLELRESEPKKFIKTIQSLPNYSDDYMGFWLSKQFLIRIKVTKGDAKSVIKTSINFKQLKNQPYMTIFYVKY